MTRAWSGTVPAMPTLVVASALLALCALALRGPPARARRAGRLRKGSPVRRAAAGLPAPRPRRATTARTPVPLVVDIHGLARTRTSSAGSRGCARCPTPNGFLVAYPDGLEQRLERQHLLRQRATSTTSGSSARWWRPWRPKQQRRPAPDLRDGALERRRHEPAAGLRRGRSLRGGRADGVSARLPSGDGCQPSRSMPVLTVMGLTDKLVPYYDGDVRIGQRGRSTTGAT